MATIHKGKFSSASTPVYRTTPKATGDTASPSAGDNTGATELWLEVTLDSYTPDVSYLLVAPKNTVIVAGDLATL